MSKFIISFEMSEERWTRQDLREFLLDVTKDEESELSLVTTEESMSVELRANVIRYLSLEEDQVFVEDGSDAVIARLSTLKSYLHLTPSQELTDKIEDEIPIELKPKDITGTQPITLSNIHDNNKVQMKYYTEIQFWSGEINAVR